MLKILVLVLAAFASHSAHAIQFGADDRVAYPNLAPDLKIRARSVAILVPKHFVGPVKADGTRDMEVTTIGELWGLKPSERFAKEPAAFVACTGFLVGEDQILTAGHCMINAGAAEHTVTPHCEDFTWLFDFHADGSGATRTKSIPAENFHDCKEVTKVAHDSETNGDGKVLSLDTDLALVKLASKPHRPALPLQLRVPGLGESLRMLGYAMGGPLLGSSGRVIGLEKNYFRGNLDAFAGNSGSPVFDSAGAVIGVMVRAAPTESLITDAAGLSTMNRCDNLGRNCLLDDRRMPAGAHVQPLLPAYLPR